MSDLRERPPGLTDASDVVLIVDDQPEHLGPLHDALDEAGYTVLVAGDGLSGLQRAALAQPDIVLLDALMPGLDGFGTARALKADARTAAIPIVFMTGLSETEHVLAAFAAGGVDHVSKPIRPAEVLARIAAHVRSARQAGQARQALDAFGHASLVVREHDGRCIWQTPLARQLMAEGFEGSSQAESALRDWLRVQAGQAAPAPLVVLRGGRRLTFRLQAPAGGDSWLVVLREDSHEAPLGALALAFGLTPREAEVLYWVTQGKTNRDIGDILGTSPRTITKHLERVFEKLGVENRTAATHLAVQRVPRLSRP